MRLCLAGDTMLGRNVAERLGEVSPAALFADEVVDAIGEADLFVVNLEYAVSERGERWPDPFKRFFFRAPPVAVEVLRHLGVGCVTLANNHTLDYGPTALLDTINHLDAAGIGWAGAGIDARGARSPIVIERADVRLGIVAVADHPPEYDAGPDRPGIAYADLRRGLPPWLRERVGRHDADAVLVSPHWGPNMVAEPVAHVRAAAAALLDAGASLVAGHSAHVFHGVGHRVLYDLGDFIDDYARNPICTTSSGCCGSSRSTARHRRESRRSRWHSTTATLGWRTATRRRGSAIASVVPVRPSGRPWGKTPDASLSSGPRERGERLRGR